MSFQQVVGHLTPVLCVREGVNPWGVGRGERGGGGAHGRHDLADELLSKLWALQSLCFVGGRGASTWAVGVWGGGGGGFWEREWGHWVGDTVRGEEGTQCGSGEGDTLAL